MKTIEIAGKVYSLKHSEKPYLPIGVFEDYLYLSQEIVRLSDALKDKTPWERRESLSPLWERMCRLFFDDIEGLSFDEIDQVDMEDLNSFFGLVVGQKTRIRRDGNVSFLDSLIAKAPSQNSPESTT